MAIAFSVFAVLVVAIGAGFWSTQRSGHEASEAGSLQAKGTLHLDTFVINLADLQQRSYLRVGVDLALNHEISREETPPVAQVRDTILAVLSQAQVEDLLTANGKAKLKTDLLHALQERIPGLGVEEVYFTEFLIQR